MKSPRRYAAPSHVCRCWLPIAALLCALVTIGATGSASATEVDEDSLAWLVPADAALVVEVTDLAPAAEAFVTGPLGERLRRFPPMKRWWDQNRAGTLRMIDDVGRYLQVPPREIWNDVLGRRVLLAAWPPEIDPQQAAPADDEEAADTPPHRQPHTLLILRSKRADTLARLVEGFCAAQQRFEQVQWTDQKYRGVVIKHGESKYRPDVYVALIDDTAVVGDTRRVVEAALDLSAGRTSRNESLAATAAYREAAAALPQGKTAWLFIPAPAWNAALAADAANSSGRAHEEKQQFLALWRGLESLSVTLRLDQQIAVQALAKFDQSRWPQPVQTLWNAVSGPTALADQMPADCLAAFAGKVDLAQLLDAVAGQPGQRQPEGWRLVRNCLAVLAGDFGGCLVEGQGELPADWVLAASVVPQWKDTSAASTPSEFLEVAIEELLRLAALQRPELSVQRDVVGQRTLLVVKHVPTAGPVRHVALAVANNWLWASSSPATVESGLAGDRERLTESAVFAGALPAELTAPSSFIFVNAARCRTLLAEQGDQLASAIAAARHTDEQRVSRGLRQLYAVLELCDRALVATQLTDRTARLAVTVAAD